LQIPPVAHFFAVVSSSLLSLSPLLAGYLAAFGGAALLCFLGAWRARRVPHFDTRRGLQVLLLTSGGWALAHVGVLLPVPAPVQSGFYMGGLVVGFATVWAWLWFCSAYTDRTLHRTRTVQRLAAGLFSVVVLVKLTNPWHQLYYTLEPVGASASSLVVRHHLLYWGGMGLSYSLAATGYLMLLELFVTTDTNTRPLALLTGLTALPAALNLVGSVRPGLLDVTHEPLGVAAFAVGVLFVHRRRFEAVRLTGGRAEPALTLRADDRIGDYNRSAAEHFPVLDDRSYIGRPLRTALPALATLLEEGRSVLKTGSPDAPRYYQMAQTRFGTEGAQGSRLIVLTDVTEREHRERALKAQQRKAKALYLQTSRLLRAQDRSEVGLSIVTLVNEVFGAPLVGVRFARDGRLVPTPRSPDAFDRMPPRPSLDVEGKSTIAEAYRHGEPLVVDDLQATDDPTDYGDARAAAFVPMGAHGVISVGALSPGAIDDFDRRLLGVLAASTRAVLDRIDREADLVEAKERAERTDRLKSAFLANMSHEIRTPLTSIIGFAETIQNEATSSDEGASVPRFARLIEDGGNRLLHTLDSLLSLSRLEAGEIDLPPQPIDLARETEAVVDDFRPTAEDAGVRLTLERIDPALEGRANRAGIRVVLRNLLSNAIKYTGEDGHVAVRARCDAGAAVLVVEDTGIGMAPERVDDLFEPFRQGSEGLDRSYEGIGLGLAVAGRAVEQMNGSLDVETEKGEGTRVAVRIPTEETTAAPEGPEASSVRPSPPRIA
jgi:signal transduction histidine kinase